MYPVQGRGAGSRRQQQVVAGEAPEGLVETAAEGVVVVRRSALVEEQDVEFRSRKPAAAGQVAEDDRTDPAPGVRGTPLGEVVADRRTGMTPGPLGGAVAGQGPCMYYNPFSNAVQFSDQPGSVLENTANPDYVAALANSEDLRLWLNEEVDLFSTSDMFVTESHPERQPRRECGRLRHRVPVTAEWRPMATRTTPATSRSTPVR